MLKYLLEKEFKQFFRNRALPKMVVMMPLVVILILPMVANFEIKNLDLTVVDNDKSPLSQRLVSKVTSSGYFRLAEVRDSYTKAIRGVELNRSDIILEIPANFERDYIRENRSSVFIAANAVSGVKGGLGSSYLAGIVGDFSQDVSAGMQISPRYWYNPRLLYTYYMVPALMVMILAMLCGFLPALNIVGEKENGTIEQMNVTPVNKFTLILSKLLPYWIIGFIVLTISFVVARIAYGLVPQGSLLTIYLFAAVFVLAMSGFGLVISNYAKTLQQAMFMMFFFVLTFILMSGLYTPVSNMPEWAQYLSNLSPLKYVITALRQIYLKGSDFSDLIVQFATLCGFAVFFNVWAVISYRKSA